MMKNKDPDLTIGEGFVFLSDRYDEIDRRRCGCPRGSRRMDCYAGGRLQSILTGTGELETLEYDLWEGQFAFSHGQEQVADRPGLNKVDEAVLDGLFKTHVESLGQKVFSGSQFALFIL